MSCDREGLFFFLFAWGDCELIQGRSFVLNELCDKVGLQDLGSSISSISAYLETRVVMLRNVKVCGS